VSEMTFGLSAQDREGLIAKGMTYGHMDAGLIRRIFKNAHRITTEMIKQYTGRDVRVDESFFSMPDPRNIKQVQELVGMLVARPALATTFGPLTDLLLQERFLKQRNGVEWLNKIFPYSNLRDRVSLVQDYFNVLRQVDAMPQSLAEKADNS